MKIKFTWERDGRASIDVVATVDANATVGDLATYLARADRQLDHGGTPGSVTLEVTGANAQVLEPWRAVGMGGLRSGATIRVTSSAAAPLNQQHAVVSVLSGPNAGTEIPVPPGQALIGREPPCDVVLDDMMVSRRHARLNVTDSVEIVDLGSANGVSVGGVPVGRASLRPSDVIRVGETDLSVRVLQPSVTDAPQGALVEFVRPPRSEAAVGGVVFHAPEPPERPKAAPFPFITVLAPLVVGAVLFAVTQSVYALFIALFPLLVLGQAVEARLTGRSGYKKAVQQWRDDLAMLVDDLRHATEREVVARRQAHPSTGECLEALARADPLLWTRRAGHEGFGELRLGLGRLPSRNRVELDWAGQQGARDMKAELDAAIAAYAEVPDVPVVAHLAVSAIGVAGPRDAALPLGRALAIQAACLHSPAELVLVALTSSQTAPDWSWFKWLPHTTSAQSPIAGGHLAASAAECSALASELEGLVRLRGGVDGGTAPRGPAVLVVVESDAPVERSRVAALAKDGPPMGIYVLWMASASGLLPAACRTFVEAGQQWGPGSVQFADEGVTVGAVQLEAADEPAGDYAGRGLAPLVDVDARVDDDSDLPRTVPGLALLGPRMATSPHAVVERWGETQSVLSGPFAATIRSVGVAPSLRAVIGQSASGPHSVDLRADGPHALVGGTTGAGKSELLQAWILGIATAHSPQRVTFLLVDYKGGSAFGECVGLPHTVGMFTDLSEHLVRCALTSLRAELTYREHILNQHDAKDLVSLERRAPIAAPPSLVIVVDEFAALANEVPEFVDGIVDVAQRGRSLGLHLILATQRPAGVIKDNLRANTNLRLALRMADEVDSIDVLGSPQAAAFDPELPGRVVVKTGPGRLVTVQAAYLGGWTTEDALAPDIAVEELAFGAGAVWEPPPAEEPTAHDPEQTDIKRLVRTVSAASELAAIPSPRQPWLPELRAVYDLADPAQIPSAGSDEALVFGVEDDPRHQAQPAVAFHPDRDGSIAVYGTGGSGKSTLLRTLAVAAGQGAHGGPCHVYGIDFGARGLAMLEGLPHVGGIIVGSDHERIVRLLKRLRSTIDERALRYHRAGAATITSYRQRSGNPDEPRVLLLVDGVAAFRAAYETTDRVTWFEMFTGIAAEGRSVGVHVVLSAEQRSALPSALASAVQRRVVLRMASADDYALLGVSTDVLTSSSPPGRGLLDGAEIQIAVLGGNPDVAHQAASVLALADSMRAGGATVAPSVEALPERVALSELPPAVDGLPVLGLASDTLAPITFTPRGSFIVTGPPFCGRTTAVQTLALALRRWYPAMAIHYFGEARSELAAAQMWTSVATGAADVAAAARTLAAELSAWPSHEAPVAVFVEGIDNFMNGAADPALQDLVRACAAGHHFFVAEAESSSMAGSFGLVGLVKGSRSGLALQPDSADGPTIFRTAFPRLDRAEFPAGRALLVHRGRADVVQVALPG